MTDHFDVRLNIDVTVAIQSNSQEEAYKNIENLSTRELLTIALEQLPFVDLDSSSIN